MKPDKPMKNPCSDCPFRKKSLKGWVGGHESAEQVASIPLSDRHYPCHKRVNDLTGDGIDFDEAVHITPPCAGAASMMNNKCKMSRDRRTADAQKVVGRRKDVFVNEADMSKYHDG